MTNIRPLTLNKVQQEKLLIILNKLFPHYYSIEVAREICDNCLPGTILFKKNKDDEGTFIHWFELCFRFTIEEMALILHPANVYNDFNKDDFCDTAIEQILLHEQHPVNYLYGQFKG